MDEKTKISVHVLANGGKYLGNDIGGASVMIRDAETQELLASGAVKGGSGAADLMTETINRQQQWDTATASVFTAMINIRTPTKILVTATGPLAARESSNTVSTTTWVIPRTTVQLTLEMPGLLCQVINPPAHTKYAEPEDVCITANVAMMCGCPIAAQDSVESWDPSNFTVIAIAERIPSGPERPQPNFIRLPLKWDAVANIPGRFTATLSGLNICYSDVWKIAVVAQQELTTNTGVAFSSFLVAAAPEASPLLQKDLHQVEIRWKNSQSPALRESKH